METQMQFKIRSSRVENMIKKLIGEGKHYHHIRVADERHNGVKLPVLLKKHLKQKIVSIYELSSLSPLIIILKINFIETIQKEFRDNSISFICI